LFPHKTSYSEKPGFGTIMLSPGFVKAEKTISKAPEQALVIMTSY
jgi:hypothetical protein